MANNEMFQRVLDAIEADPDRHNQTYWAKKTPCGTAFCLAGWAVHLNGDKIIWTSHVDELGEIQEEAFECETPEGKTTSILMRANDVLGIDTNYLSDVDGYVGNLYSATATMNEIHEMVSFVTEGAVTGPSNNGKA